MARNLRAQWIETSGDRGIFWDAEECDQPIEQEICGGNKGESGIKEVLSKMEKEDLLNVAA